MASGGAKAKTSVAKPNGGGESGQTSAAGDNAASNKQGGPVAPPVKQASAPNKPTVAEGQAQTEQPDPYKLRDLIAQEDMAYWAMWMFLAAVATFLVTSIGTFLIWRQVKLTRQAVEDTSEATEAMRGANKIAEDTAKRQLRAYMGIRKYELEPYELGEAGTGRFLIAMTNFGQSPAIELTTTVSYAIRDWHGQAEEPEAWDYETGKNPLDIAPGAPMFRQIDFSDHALAHLVELKTGASVLYVRFHAQYRDIYGRQHEQTTFFFSRHSTYCSKDMLVMKQTRETSTEPEGAS